MNWGTVTPDAWWLANCSSCLLTASPYPTTTPYPTTEWGATSTASALLTTTPTPSLTPTVGLTPSPIWSPTPQTNHYYTLSVGAAGSATFSPCNGWCADQFTNSDAIVLPDNLVGFVWGHVNGYNGAFSHSDVFWENAGGSSIFVNHETTDRANGCWWVNNAVINPGGRAACDMPGFYTTGTMFAPITGLLGETRYIRLRHNGYVGNGQPSVTSSWNVTHLIFYGSNEPIPTPTPGPTSTPEGDGYCYLADGTTSGGGGDLDGILPNPMLGPTECRSIPAFEVDMSALAWLPGLEVLDDPLSFPGLQVCIRAITFGTSNLFGVIFDFDAVAIVAMAALVIGIILRS